MLVEKDDVDGTEFASWLRSLGSAMDVTHSLFLALILFATHTHTGRLVNLGIPHGAVHSCVWQAEHALCMPHTHRLFTWVRAAYTHTCTHTHLYKHRQMRAGVHASMHEVARRHPSL